MITRRALFAAAAALAGTGCYGKFALTRKLYDWNGSLGNKFVNTLVMWVLMIIPVYGVVTFIDGFILNLIEFWSGSNPLATVDHEDGSQTRMTRLSTDRVRLEHVVNGVPVKTLELHRPSDRSGMAVNSAGEVVAQAELLESGDVVATTEHGVVTLSNGEIQALSHAGSLTLAVAARVNAQSASARTLAAR